MSKKNKEQIKIEELLEQRKDLNNFLSGEELAEEAKKSFLSRKEFIREVLDKKSH